MQDGTELRLHACFKPVCGLQQLKEQIMSSQMAFHDKDALLHPWHRTPKHARDLLKSRLLYSS
jgi:hypothetical protein